MAGIRLWQGSGYERDQAVGGIRLWQESGTAGVGHSRDQDISSVAPSDSSVLELFFHPSHSWPGLEVRKAQVLLPFLLVSESSVKLLLLWASGRNNLPALHFGE